MRKALLNSANLSEKPATLRMVLVTLTRDRSDSGYRNLAVWYDVKAKHLPAVDTIMKGSSFAVPYSYEPHA
ncbi:MAG: hypothetical protein ACAF41_10055 [Leptolyngbya sp. BL-A-14]